MNNDARESSFPDLRSGLGGMIARLQGILATVIAVILAVSGATLLIGGAVLLSAGGSAYYAPSGAVLLLTALLVFRRNPWGVILFGAFTLLTVGWALWEVGLDGWALMPRLAAIAVALGLVAATGQSLRGPRDRVRLAARLSTALSAIALAVVALLVAAASSFTRGPPSREAAEAVMARTHNGSLVATGGQAFASTHFSPDRQIDPDNVRDLKVAWEFHSGDRLGPDEYGGFEVAPVEAEDRVYFCTPHSIAVALDAATGKELWRYDPKPAPHPGSFAVCRGVTHYEVEAADSDGRCRRRIALATLDFRLISLDAEDGRPCPGFGTSGIVDLSKGFPRLPRAAVIPTAAPTFVNGSLVLGHFVADNQRTDAPPGVVRAFDATSGAFRWAWDIGRPGVTTEPAQGQTYSLGRPNAWAQFTPDPELGMVFVPTGNPGGDYFGGKRTQDMLKCGSSIVALDSATGIPRWTFQTVHHDVWDYDVPSPPALFDFPTGRERVPALAQSTKTGQIFVLRRSDGKPLVPVEERPVDTRAAPGESLSPTQPFSTMPDFGGPDLTEEDAWGLTPIDQMLCRIEFRKSHYTGRFTALQTEPTIFAPGYLGGMDWGGVAIDPFHDILITNTNRIANRGWLIPHDGPVKAQGDPGQDDAVNFPYPQKGTGYSAHSLSWFSALQVPCQRPPWGLLTAIDLVSRKIVWQRPLGDSSRSGPLGIPVRFALTIGTPNQGGAITTASGLTFIGATVDAKFRAFETATGKLLWEHGLPGGGQANPISYTSNGTQFVVIAAGGHKMLGSPESDVLIAFRLPKAAQ